MKRFFRSLPAIALHLCFAFMASAQFKQQGPKLVGSGVSGPLVYQGESVALSADGNTAIVGGFSDNLGVGAAWVFTRIGGAWTQQGTKLVGSGAIGISWQGVSVAVSGDGNTVLVGGSADNSYLGAAWVFTRFGGVWSQQGGKLVGSGASRHAEQGWSVALSADGNTALLGGPEDNFVRGAGPSGTGAAWVFMRSSTGWSQQDDKLVGSGASGPAGQGGSVALSADGSTALVGGRFDNGVRGAAWVFVAQPSTISLSASANPSVYGQTVTFTATVSAWATGTVTFIVDGVAQATVVLNGSQAQFALANIAAGNHTISAAYSEDSSYFSSTNNVLSQTVNPPPVTRTLISSPNPSTVEQAVTLTASLFGGDGALAGTVQFLDGPISLGSAPVSGGQARLTTSTLSPGSHAIVAKYIGDASAQASMRQVVNGMAKSRPNRCGSSAVNLSSRTCRDGERSVSASGS